MINNIIKSNKFIKLFKIKTAMCEFNKIIYIRIVNFLKYP